MRTIAVTGASSYAGRVFIEAIESHPTVSRVIGIDTTQPSFTTRQLEFYEMDLRSSQLTGALRGCQVLVHLGFAENVRDPAEMRDINVGGTRMVLEAALAAGVRKIVHGSSTTVYGAHPDNDFPLTEESLARPLRDFPNSAQRAEAEGIVRAFAQSHSDVQVVILRPSLTMGPSVEGFVARIIESPYMLGVSGYDPPFQVVHEADVARAFVHALDSDLVGVYNVCPDDWMDLSAAARGIGRRLVTADHAATARQAERMWRLHLSELTAAHLPFVMYPWVASNTKLKATGFTFEHSMPDILRAGAEARKGWISVGPTRFRPRRIALIAGTVGAVLLGSAARGRARRAKRETDPGSSRPRPRTRR
jgi:nucleoside-diphosphate-sugar epimerase